MPVHNFAKGAAISKQSPLVRATKVGVGSPDPETHGRRRCLLEALELNLCSRYSRKCTVVY